MELLRGCTGGSQVYLRRVCAQALASKVQGTEETLSCSLMIKSLLAAGRRAGRGDGQGVRSNSPACPSASAEAGLETVSSVWPRMCVPSDGGSWSGCHRGWLARAGTCGGTCWQHLVAVLAVAAGALGAGGEEAAGRGVRVPLAALRLGLPPSSWTAPALTDPAPCTPRLWIVFTSRDSGGCHPHIATQPALKTARARPPWVSWPWHPSSTRWVILPPRGAPSLLPQPAWPPSSLLPSALLYSRRPGREDSGDAAPASSPSV